MGNNNLNGKLIIDGLTFDDVLLIPQKSTKIPNEVDVETKLTKKITLKIPFISSAMDTVTESKMAIAMARQGGIGIIHKNLSIEEQSAEVDKVKRNESGFIKDPIILHKNATIQEANDLMSKYRISGLPIVENNMKLVGLITNRDIKYANNSKLKVENVMIKNNLITAPPGISLENAANIMLKNRIEKLPIINKDNILKGLITIKDIDNKKEYPNAAKDNLGRLLCGAAVGINSGTLERVKALVNSKVDIIVVDSAHGHSSGVISIVKEIRKKYPNLDIIAGNVVTAQAAHELINAGADVIKVGVGPGSICTTRIIAGVGMPQISAINDIYQVCKLKKISIIADGGIKFSGDVVKAIAAGANAVMMGGALAGCFESPGEEIIINGRKYKKYVGMGSVEAMQRGSSDRYFQSNKNKLVPEGIEACVTFKGKVEDILYQFVGGLRSGMGYVGAHSINDLIKNSKFVKITSAGLIESHPHDVIRIKDAPNYNYNDNKKL